MAGRTREAFKNCTLTGNSAQYAGGAQSGTLADCIAYYNTAIVEGANYMLSYGSSLYRCCTFPMPASGSGNITNEPALVSASHLSTGSPCRGAASYATGTDIDGQTWLNPPSIGCDEYYSGPVTGLLAVALSAEWTNVAAGFPPGFKATIVGRPSVSVWNFGDGVVASNLIYNPYVSHSWSAPGTYPVVLTAYNESNPGGVSATATVQVVTSPIYYVSLDSATPTAPYSSWETAARTIQQAVDVAWAGGLVLVSNGVYTTGGKAVHGTMTNRVAVWKPLELRSLNGPEATIIRGYQMPGVTNGANAIRCVHLASGAILSGFTLTNGATHDSGDYEHVFEENGGGAWCASADAVLTNCTLTGNSAFYHGGGVYQGTLNNCNVRGNRAFSGGGAYKATLKDSGTDRQLRPRRRRRC